MSNTAVDIINEARESHVVWAEYFEEHPDAVDQLEPQVDIAGDAAYHREWVKKYDVVLEALNG